MQKRRDPSSWPYYVYETLDILSLVDVQEPHAVDSYLQGFVQRWGGLDPVGVAHALNEAEGDDRLFAIFIVRYVDAPHARAWLIPLLDNSEPLIRWASALTLGELREPQALSTLCDMLTEFQPADLEAMLTATSRFEAWRGGVPYGLEMLQLPQAVPALRQALHRLCQVLRQERLAENDALLFRRVSPHAGALSMQEHARLAAIVERSDLLPIIQPPLVMSGEDVDGHADVPFGTTITPATTGAGGSLPIDRSGRRVRLHHLVRYQDDIVYALGRLGALGSLVGVRVAEPFLQIWMVHLLMGYLHDQFLRSDIDPSLRLSAPLESRLKGHLLRNFGLTDEEQERALMIYRWTKLSHIVGKYMAEEHLRK